MLRLFGRTAAGPSTRTFVLPSLVPPLDPVPLLPSPPPSRPSSTSPILVPEPRTCQVHPLPIVIRDTTLLASGTGFRTWGAATLLARRLSLSPAAFFPTLSSPSSPSSPSSLRVLELGSGTGLVGLTASALLHRLRQPSAIQLTDFDPIALSNLAHNLELNFPILCPTSIAPLDWANVPASVSRHDVILAADVVYEPAHALLVRSAVAALLAFPSPGAPAPAFHAVLPLRRTHVAEHEGFDTAFAPGGRGVVEWDAEGCGWRLETKSREEESGRDGFGRAGEGESRYWVYRIEWVAESGGALS